MSASPSPSQPPQNKFQQTQQTQQQPAQQQQQPSPRGWFSAPKASLSASECRIYGASAQRLFRAFTDCRYYYLWWPPTYNFAVRRCSLPPLIGASGTSGTSGTSGRSTRHVLPPTVAPSVGGLNASDSVVSPVVVVDNADAASGGDVAGAGADGGADSAVSGGDTTDASIAASASLVTSTGTDDASDDVLWQSDDLPRFGPHAGLDDATIVDITCEQGVYTMEVVGESTRYVPDGTSTVVLKYGGRHGGVFDGDESITIDALPVAEDGSERCRVCYSADIVPKSRALKSMMLFVTESTAKSYFDPLFDHLHGFVEREEPHEQPHPRIRALHKHERIWAALVDSHHAQIPPSRSSITSNATTQAGDPAPAQPPDAAAEPVATEPAELGGSAKSDGQPAAGSPAAAVDLSSQTTAGPGQDEAAKDFFAVVGLQAAAGAAPEETVSNELPSLPLAGSPDVRDDSAGAAIASGESLDDGTNPADPQPVLKSAAPSPIELPVLPQMELPSESMQLLPVPRVGNAEYDSESPFKPAREDLATFRAPVVPLKVKQPLQSAEKPSTDQQPPAPVTPAPLPAPLPRWVVPAPEGSPLAGPAADSSNSAESAAGPSAGTAVSEIVPAARGEVDSGGTVDVFPESSVYQQIMGVQDNDYEIEIPLDVSGSLDGEVYVTRPQTKAERLEAELTTEKQSNENNADEAVPPQAEHRASVVQQDRSSEDKPQNKTSDSEQPVPGATQAPAGVEQQPKQTLLPRKLYPQPKTRAETIEASMRQITHDGTGVDASKDSTRSRSTAAGAPTRGSPHHNTQADHVVSEIGSGNSVLQDELNRALTPTVRLVIPPQTKAERLEAQMLAKVSSSDGTQADMSSNEEQRPLAEADDTDRLPLVVLWSRFDENGNMYPRPLTLAEAIESEARKKQREAELEEMQKRHALEVAKHEAFLRKRQQLRKIESAIDAADKAFDAKLGLQQSNPSNTIRTAEETEPNIVVDGIRVRIAGNEDTDELQPVMTATASFTDRTAAVDALDTRDTTESTASLATKPETANPPSH